MGAPARTAGQGDSPRRHGLQCAQYGLGSLGKCKSVLARPAGAGPQHRAASRPDRGGRKSLEIRLLGGFDLRCGEEPVQRFESQKARALVAYLAMHHGQSISRERLSTLLWAEKDEQAARRNLRQVLYSLRSLFREVAPDLEVFTSGAQEVGLEPGVDLWLDVFEFEAATARGLTEDGPDPHQLSVAARLYNGEFLTGFYIRDSPPFEDWMVACQERLREAALESFRTLVESCLSRGESRLGIHYARRLLSLDPLSEGAHRNLMRLYGQSGRRTRALAQYEELRNLLNQELGVEPLEETTSLYQAMLLEEVPNEDPLDSPIGPLIPLAGRSQEFERLQESWHRVLATGARMTVVRGESGIGKTRLVKSFVDGASSQRKVLVVRGRAYERSPAVAFAPLAEVVVTIFADLMPDQEIDAERLPPSVVADLNLLAPQLGTLEPALLGTEWSAESPDPARFADSLSLLLEELVREPEGALTPVILMLEDLHGADRETLDLLAALYDRIGDLPVWIVVTCAPAGGSSPPLLDPAAAAGLEPAIEHLALARLEPAAVREIARSLVRGQQADRLGDFLDRWSEGLPLAITELINYLWDEGALVVRDPAGWRLDDSFDGALEPPADLDELIQHRFRRLPASARRLLAVGGIIGQRFDVDLAAKAADEHLAVVEACIELMLQRWLIRQFPRTWTHTRRERDIVLWARGVRRGAFEFAHEQIRTAVLDSINPLRRKVMHQEVATAMILEHGDDLEAVCEAIAYHSLAGGEPEQALVHLERAAQRARRAGAAATEARYLKNIQASLKHLPSRARAAAQRTLEKRAARPRSGGRPAHG